MSGLPAITGRSSKAATSTENVWAALPPLRSETSSEICWMPTWGCVGVQVKEPSESMLAPEGPELRL